MAQEDKELSYRYKCTQCGTVMMRKTKVKPTECTFCGGYNIINVDQGDRSTRFGKTKPAKIVTK